VECDVVFDYIGFVQRTHATVSMMLIADAAGPFD
jgi:hypothetical protein